MLLPRVQVRNGLGSVALEQILLHSVEEIVLGLILDRFLWRGGILRPNRRRRGHRQDGQCGRAAYPLRKLLHLRLLASFP